MSWVVRVRNGGKAPGLPTQFFIHLISRGNIYIVPSIACTHLYGFLVLANHLRGHSTALPWITANREQYSLLLLCWQSNTAACGAAYPCKHTQHGYTHTQTHTYIHIYVHTHKTHACAHMCPITIYFCFDFTSDRPNNDKICKTILKSNERSHT